MKKRQRLFPDQPLGPPKKAFADTFSAETVIMESFFGGLKHEQQKAALEYRGEENLGDLDAKKRS